MRESINKSITEKISQEDVFVIMESSGDQYEVLAKK